MKKLSRYPLLLACLLAVGAIAASVPQSAPRALEIKLCEDCRRTWDDSPSRMRMLMTAGKREFTIHVCSPFCLAEQLERYPNRTLAQVQVVVWKDRNEVTSPTMANAMRAHYLMGIPGDEQEVHAPFVAAFQTERQASTEQEKLGGDMVDWDVLLNHCIELAREHEDAEKRHGYEPLKSKRHKQSD